MLIICIGMSSNASAQEHWYNITFMDIKIGYMYRSTEKTKYQGETVDHNKMVIVTKIPFGNAKTFKITQEEYTGRNSRPRSFFFTSNELGLRHVKGRIANGIAYIETTHNGKTTKSEVVVPPDTLSDFTTLPLLFPRGLIIGNKRKYYYFSADECKPIKTEIEVIRRDTLTHQSEVKQVYVLRQAIDSTSGTTLMIWVDSNGVYYRIELQMQDTTIVVTRTDKNSALRGTELVNVDTVIAHQ